jgi:Flp pilus assembly pilin Flp
MSAILLFTAVRMQAAARAIASRIADDERGQDTIEYLGVLLVVAALIGLVIGVVPQLRQTILGGANDLISSVFNAKAQG